MRNRVLSSWILLWSAGCGGGADLSTPPPPEVTVAEVRAENLAEWDEYQGEFEAIDAVEIRPRVSGYLVRVPFAEGKEVRKGDVLFEIDPEPYQATLDERQSRPRPRTRARLALVERDAERGERLVKAQAISQEEMDTRLTLVSEARAAVAAGRGGGARGRAGSGVHQGPRPGRRPYRPRRGDRGQPGHGRPHGSDPPHHRRFARPDLRLLRG